MPHEFRTRLTERTGLAYVPHTTYCLLLFLVRLAMLSSAFMDTPGEREQALWEIYGRTKKKTRAAGSFAHTRLPAASFFQRRVPA